ncbi:MAG: hypothetical protein COT84_05425 [Chlamydiae bacterium CG10_big_fil_rev_8_21_14_0_10_35_9]|nr:MAG: hypothetical protein COT84_05425 [Chlamydiae bacterium CG10_big_fil_rev_8_21_14_0_10_35_9]
MKIESLFHIYEAYNSIKFREYRKSVNSLFEPNVTKANRCINSLVSHINKINSSSKTITLHKRKVEVKEGLITHENSVDQYDFSIDIDYGYSSLGGRMLNLRLFDSSRVYMKKEVSINSLAKRCIKILKSNESQKTRIMAGVVLREIQKGYSNLNKELKTRSLIFRTIVWIRDCFWTPQELNEDRYSLEFTYKNWVEISDVKLKAQSKEEAALIKEKKRSLAILSEEIRGKRKEINLLESGIRTQFRALADLNTMNAAEFVSRLPEDKRNDLLVSIAKATSRLPYFFRSSAIRDGQNYVSNNNPIAISLVDPLKNRLREVALDRINTIPIDRKIVELNKLSVRRDQLTQEINTLEG